MCIDKKPSALNFILGRGKTVVAEATLKPAVIKKVLKTTPETMQEVCYRKNLVGSAQAGSYGFNAHFANIVAAMFIATGQDPAQVVSGSMGFTLMEQQSKNLHVSVTLPALCVATVGGGTALDTQSEALEIMGLKGGGKPGGSNAEKLAHVVASAAMAGEVSLVSALASRHLGSAHAELGR
jgi:hydroxymethylglutaryl-CoA reductase (NADPH)